MNQVIDLLRRTLMTLEKLPAYSLSETQTKAQMMMEIAQCVMQYEQQVQAGKEHIAVDE